MINPRPADVLKTIIANLESKVEPKLTDVDVLSAVTTCKHMVRYVLYQLAQERTIYLAELPRLNELLGQSQAFLAVAEGQQALAQATAEALNADAGDLGDIEALAARVLTLREALYQVLSRLTEQRDALRGQHGYQELRAAIRDYLAWQNVQDEAIIGPSFFGQGPRR